MKRFSTLAAALLLTVCAASSSYAVFGGGLHWGWDFSLSMKDAQNEPVKLKGADVFDIPMPSGFTLPSGFVELIPGQIEIPEGTEFFKVSRTDWERHILNFGGKLYVDIIPIIKIFELSFNLGVWQYQGSLEYLNINTNSTDLTNLLTYETQKMTLDELDKSYFGLSGTPFAKLQFDATVRPFVFKMPVITASAGLGMSVHFATPLLSGLLVEDVRLDEKMSPEDFLKDLAKDDSKVADAIVQKIIDELFTPRYGMHLVAGVKVKPPLFPVGVYIDGKLMIPFSKFDENKQINALGFLLNTGVSLSF